MPMSSSQKRSLQGIYILNYLSRGIKCDARIPLAYSSIIALIDQSFTSSSAVVLLELELQEQTTQELLQSGWESS